MPDDRLERTRAAYRSLPIEFETAEARYLREHYLEPAIRWHMDDAAKRIGYDAGWRRPSDNAAAQLARTAAWNVIEGDPH